MVNYCCVYGCGKNSRTSKHLYYYSLPKEKDRLMKWIAAIGRDDLLTKDEKKLTHRVCSRHFSLSSIKNKHLCSDAVPTLCLPNSPTNKNKNSEQTNKNKISEQDGTYEPAASKTSHNNVVCNSCSKQIVGFRYKCISCQDYDLCSKCEMFEAHDHHYLLRIPKPVNFLTADYLVKKWQKLFKAEELGEDNELDDECSSDDDVPITKLAKTNDSGVELSQEVKNKLRSEVTRVLNMKLDNNSEEVPRKKAKLQKKVTKKKKSEDIPNNRIETDVLESMGPELVFADVNEEIFDVKDENCYSLENMTESASTATQIKLNDELSEFLIGVKYP